MYLQRSRHLTQRLTALQPGDGAQLELFCDFSSRLHVQFPPFNDFQGLTGRLKIGVHSKIDILERHIADLDKSLAKALVLHQEAIERLCEIPGISVRTAQHIIAETGPRAEAFAVAGKLASWAGMCPGQQESAGTSVSSRSAKGNWMLRRTLCQTAWAAIAAKGSEAQRRFQRWRPRLGTQKAAWAIAHYQIRIVWKVLHDGVRYCSPDTEVMTQHALVARAKRALNDLRKLGYAVSITPPASQTARPPVS
jgi:transposase